jgi:uncharacterized protein
VIIETLFSTLDAGGLPNFAPMGIVWGEDEVTVRPFRSTHTCRHLLATGHGVANVTDDVLAFVQSALDDIALPHFPAVVVPGVVFQGACSWRELVVVCAGGGAERAEIQCRVVHKGWQRYFLGFNRARGAVLEAAILATRLHLHEPRTVPAELMRYREIVQKTGDEAERMALERVDDFVRRWLNDRHR